MNLAIKITLTASGIFLFIGMIGGVGAIVWGFISTQFIYN